MERGGRCGVEEDDDAVPTRNQISTAITAARAAEPRKSTRQSAYGATAAASGRPSPPFDPHRGADQGEAAPSPSPCLAGRGRRSSAPPTKRARRPRNRPSTAPDRPAASGACPGCRGLPGAGHGRLAGGGHRHLRRLSAPLQHGGRAAQRPPVAPSLSLRALPTYERAGSHSPFRAPPAMPHPPDSAIRRSCLPAATAAGQAGRGCSRPSSAQELRRPGTGADRTGKHTNPRALRSHRDRSSPLGGRPPKRVPFAPSGRPFRPVGARDRQDCP